ncbi:hypothetical protein [Bacillus sp. OTU2372]|uniref:hypothetical protein n=1 Tax=Bacillus sp. OTU2372 TaxID=3043858 RepID=UPI00313E54DA
MIKISGLLRQLYFFVFSRNYLENSGISWNCVEFFRKFAEFFQVFRGINSKTGGIVIVFSNIFPSFKQMVDTRVVFLISILIRKGLATDYDLVPTI